MQTRASRKRSVVKAITYRGIIICLDFLVIDVLTGKVMTAAAFMIVQFTRRGIQPVFGWGAPTGAMCG